MSHIYIFTKICVYQISLFSILSLLHLIDWLAQVPDRYVISHYYAFWKMGGAGIFIYPLAAYLGRDRERNRCMLTITSR